MATTASIQPLFGKSAIVTGASRGIGAGIAIELARQGADVALVYTSTSSIASAQEVANEIAALGRKHVLIKKDLSLEDAGSVVKMARDGLGVETIDILVNNAGALKPYDTEKFDNTVWQR